MAGVATGRLLERAAGAAQSNAQLETRMQATGCPKLDSDLAEFQALTTLDPGTAEKLAAALTAAYKRLLQADLGDYDVAAIRAHADHALDDMFLVRVALRERLEDWHSRGLFSTEAERALRNVFRIGRYATDMLCEVILAQPPVRSAKIDDIPAFSGNPLQTIINPLHKSGEHFEFRSGDVLLVRGSLSTSAAIARIGDIDSQFSHIGIVHVGSDGRRRIVEALIEKGAVVSDLDTALAHGLARAVLMRPRDQQLAARAADWIKGHVEDSQTGKVPHIPYDFSMEMWGYDKLYCSKLIRMAFDQASNGQTILPRFPTLLSMPNRDFVNRIGVTATETFAPGDVELDPNFDLVAEWRDVRRTTNLRLQDAVMDKHFEWMDDYGYVYRETFLPWMVSIFGRFSSYFPQFAKDALVSLGLPEVPRNMTRRTISAIAMMTWTTTPIVKALEKRDRKVWKRTGRQMHLREAYERLDAYRQRRGDQIGFLFRPPRRRRDPLAVQPSTA